MSEDSAPMPDKLSDRELLLAQVVVLFARAAMIQNDLDFIEGEIKAGNRDMKESYENKRISRDIALLALWIPLMKLIDSTPDWAERIK